jgi:hypothetical protein
LRPDVFKWVGVVRAESPVGDRAEFGVGVAHRVVHRVMPCVAHVLAATGEPLEEETIHPFDNEQDLYLRLGRVSRDLGPI